RRATPSPATGCSRAPGAARSRARTGAWTPARGSSSRSGTGPPARRRRPRSASMPERERPLRVLVSGGGTGGHLYPGIAIAEEVKTATGGEAIFVGTARGLETRLVPAGGFPLELVKVSGLKRMGMRGLLRGLLRLPGAFMESARILRRHRPDVVLGVGGYASGPLVFASALLGYPTAIQEQNSLPGFTNRVLGKLVRRVFVAFDAAAARFARRKVRFVGNPVRRSFLDRVAAANPADEGTAVAILRGSQG